MEIRKRAAALDGGKALQAEIAALHTVFAVADGNAKALSGEQHDIELRQKGYEEKIDRFNKQLFEAVQRPFFWVFTESSG